MFVNQICRRWVLYVSVLLMGIVIIFLSLMLGRSSVSFVDILQVIYGRVCGTPTAENEFADLVLFDVRLPRVTAAFLIGAALSASGTAYQGLFKNPMVSPDILGASAGAGFGAAMAILMGLDISLVQLFAFLGGILAVTIACLIASSAGGDGRSHIIILVLAGILVSTIFSSLISLTKLCADPDDTLPAITFWLMGGLGGVRADQLGGLLMMGLIGVVPLLMLRWRFDILSFGAEEAQALGINVGRMRILIICCATLLTSACVALCGMVGFVGLVIPHVTRLVFGASHAVVLPGSLMIGGFFLVLVDDVARCAFPVEVPLGILSSLIGAPFFLFLLMRQRSSWL